MGYSGINALYAADTINPPGRYLLAVEGALKGHCPKTLLILTYQSFYHLTTITRPSMSSPGQGFCLLPLPSK